MRCISGRINVPVRLTLGLDLDLPHIEDNHYYLAFHYISRSSISRGMIPIAQEIFNKG